MKRTALKRKPKRAVLREPSDTCTFRVPSIKRKRSKPRRGPMRDQRYMDWLKDRDCVACRESMHPLYVYVSRNAIRGTGRRAFPCDPAHTINNGRGSKGPDSSCIPLCRHHHDEMDGRASTAVTTKAKFAAKYSLDLAQEAAAHYALYLIDKENQSA